MKPAKHLFIALMLAVPAAIHAQGAASGMTYEQFNHIDKDASGSISQTEYFQFMEGSFKALDTDKNNSLSPAETSHIFTAEQFSRTDANGDGRINRQEFLDQVMSDFHRQDHDKDGQLTP